MDAWCHVDYVKVLAVESGEVDIIITRIIIEITIITIRLIISIIRLIIEIIIIR